MRRQYKLVRFRSAIIALFVLTALSCFADELAVLKNGFSIRHARREVVGETTRLYVNRDGSSFVDVPTAELDHFEEAPNLAAAPPMASGPVASSGSRRPASGSPTLVKSSAPAGMNVGMSFPARPKANISEVVNEASGRYQLDPDLVNSVIKAESGFNVRAVSPKGARGLMQLMPGTASQLGVPNSFDAQANVEGGTKYLRELLERYDFDLVKALAAYNAGPERVEHFGGVPPYYETRTYVARIVKDFNKKKVAQQRAATTAAKAKKSTVTKNAGAKASGSAAQTTKASVQAKAAPSGN